MTRGGDRRSKVFESKRYATKAPANLKTIHYFFPVRRHSFLYVADRVFGRFEKIIKKKTKILTKEEYYGAFKQVGNVNILKDDWVLYDIKHLSESLKK
ncbi:hypothetical protein ILUMI_10427 [Ignelater luminosus]|uniref:Uncharacterized protein n=1 Tax=Ignelater luminosus TaxID=2038154 RepID=A0A8K0D299_IGNLU|nr:hypothetical protein ILUMI_10427 [Ignelater luminosus]